VKQAPAWNRVVQAFAKNSMVAFGDVNLAEDPVGGPYQAGAGGWPTVRYFNKATGIGGAPYTKKTSDAMCTELGNDKYMEEYVTEAGSTSKCDIASKENCTQKELDYIEKFSAKPPEELTSQMERLAGMASSSMKPELRSWLGQRMNALNQLSRNQLAQKEEL